MPSMSEISNNLNYYFAKCSDAVSTYLPQSIRNFNERVWKNPIPFAISNIYDRSCGDNIAISYPALPFSASPTLVVVSGNKQNMQAVTSYGEGDKNDDAARKPLDFIKDMAGTENIINMTGDNSVTQRKKIKPFLTEKNSLANAYSHSQELFNQLDNWENNISFKNQVSYCCINVIARSVLGIPMLTREQASVITRAGNLLRESESNSAEFAEGQEALAKLNDELLTQYKDVLLTNDNYIHEKAAITATDTDAEKIKKLSATRGVSNLLVESNLTALIMIGIVYVNKSESIRNRLMEEIASNTEMSLENIRKLSYLDCVYKEALRFASPTPMIIRETSKAADLNITDDRGNQKFYRVPCHSLLFAPIRRMHHDPRYWEKPEEFKPERFEDPLALKHFIPFSVGTRSCPAASHFNEIVFKAAILASIKYQLEFDKEIEQIPADSLTSRWKQEYYITKIEPIRSKTFTLCKK